MFGFLGPIVGGIGKALGIGAASGAAAGGAGAATGLGGFLSSAGGQALIQGGTKLIGGAMQRREARKNPPHVDFAKLRTEAEAAGFNPLTALKATGGAGFQTGQTPVSLGAILQSAGESAISAYNENDPVRKEAARLENELTRARIDALTTTASLPAPGVTRKVSQGNDTVPRSMPSMTSEGQIRPRSRQDAFGLLSEGLVMVALPDGQLGQVPRKTLERFIPPDEVKNGMALIGGDYEEILGDLAGQTVLAPRVPGAVQQNFGGLSGYGQKERQKNIDDNMSIQQLLPGWMSKNIQDGSSIQQRRNRRSKQQGSN